jgi:hypothetical protein
LSPASQPTPSPNVASASTYQGNQAGGSHAKKWWLILLTIAILAGAGYAGYAHFKNSIHAKGTKPQAATSNNPANELAANTIAAAPPVTPVTHVTPVTSVAPVTTAGTPATTTAVEPTGARVIPPLPANYTPPHWIFWPIPRETASVNALYYQATQHSPLDPNQTSGVFLAGGAFEGFIATSKGLGITKIRLRFDRADDATLTSAGTPCTLEAMDTTGGQQVRTGRLIQGVLKFDATAAGPTVIAANPRSVFDGGAFNFQFYLNQYGLVGHATEADWILLLEPAK